MCEIIVFRSLKQYKEIFKSPGGQGYRIRSCLMYGKYGLIRDQYYWWVIKSECETNKTHKFPHSKNQHKLSDFRWWEARPLPTGLHRRNSYWSPYGRWSKQLWERWPAWGPTDAFDLDFEVWYWPWNIFNWSGVLYPIVIIDLHTCHTSRSRDSPRESNLSLVHKMRLLKSKKKKISKYQLMASVV